MCDRYPPTMRILIIEHGLGHGGSIVSLARVLSQLDGGRLRPMVLLDSHDASTEFLQRSGLKVVRCAQPFEWAFRHARLPAPLSYAAYATELLVSVIPQTARLCRLIRRERIDLVHLNNHLEQYAGILAGWLCGVPRVVYLRNTARRRLRKTERLAARLVDRFITLSMFGRDHYVNQGLPSERVAVVYDPVFCNGASPNDGAAVRQEFGIPPDAPLIGILSRLARGKGHDHFLHAAKIVSQRHPHTRFLIAGSEHPREGSVTRQLHGLVNELGLEGRIIFTGWRSDIPAIIAALDVVVDPSTLQEGTRLTVLESMSMGKPVVATDVGSESEFFTEGRGILIEPGRSDQLAEAILRLLEDKGRAREMGQKAQELALDRCNPLHAARQLACIYEEALADGPLP